MADFSVPVETFRIQWRGGGGITVPRLALRDRRAAGHRQLHWIYQRHLENVLYKRDGDGGTSGAIWKILNHTGLGSTALQVNGSAVANGHVTQAEYNEIVARFKLSTDGLDPCSKGRIRSCTLLPIATAAAVCRTFGRSDESVAFLRMFNQPVPEAWELREQAEEDAARGEHDLLLQEQLESLGQELELEDVDSFEQELQQMHPFTADADEETRMKTYAMANPPSMLTTEMKHYVISRTTVLDGRRSGSAVVSATVEGDTQSVLRFFGYLQRTHRVPDGAYLYPSLFFVRPDLGDLVQGYAEWLRENQRLRWCSIANYLNSLAQVTHWVYSTYTIPPATTAMEPSPLGMIYNLRLQAEGQSKTEQMFDKRVGGWIDWADVQKARLEAVKLATANRGDLKLLRDAAALSLLSLIPPDRVGLIRKLRLGHTLKKAAGGGWRLDLSKQRDGHKTSKFYGPFAAKLPDELTPVLDLYASALEMANVDGGESYLFHPTTGKGDRAMESSAWSMYVSRLFKKITGTAIAPKTLRSIFITWLKESTNCPEILKSAAHAMKHQVATQESAHYDANADTKLVKAAYDFNLTFVASLTSDGAAGSGSGGAAGSSGASHIHIPPDQVFVSPAPPTQPPQPPQPQSPPPVVNAPVQAGIPAAVAVDQRSHIPAAELTANLNGVDFERSSARGNGDCYPLSAMAGFEISASAARAPKPKTTAAVREVRKGSVTLLTGSDPIGGIDAHVVRECELIPVAPAEARNALAPWLNTGHWLGDDGGNKSTFFMLGVACHLGRPIAVIEKDGRDFLNHARIYGARNAHGALMCTSSRGTTPVTIPAFSRMSLTKLLDKLRATPKAYSLIEYNGSNHFNPWLYKPSAAPAAAAGSSTAIEDEDDPEEAKPPSIAATEEADEEMDDEDELAANAVQAAVRSNHVELNLGLEMPPALSSLAARARETLCRSNMPLAGEGEATVEVDAMAALALNGEAEGAPVAQVVGPVVEARRSGRAAKMPRLSFPPAASTSTGPVSSGRDVSDTDAFDVTGIAVGDTLLAKGFAPSGNKEWFQAQVTALRPPPAFPPIVVKFVATEDGNKLALALPRPRTAYVLKADTMPLP